MNMKKRLHVSKVNPSAKENLRKTLQTWLSHQDQGVQRMHFIIESLSEELAAGLLKKVVVDLKVQANSVKDRLSHELDELNNML
jgi:hypothetical protein